MANFIGLTGAYGERVMVNADHIITMEYKDDSTFLSMSRGYLRVAESIYDIVEMLEPESEV